MYGNISLRFSINFEAKTLIENLRMLPLYFSCLYTSHVCILLMSVYFSCCCVLPFS